MKQFSTGANRLGISSEIAAREKTTGKLLRLKISPRTSRGDCAVAAVVEIVFGENTFKTFVDTGNTMSLVTPRMTKK